MESRPRQRSRLVFWLSMLVFIAAIAATALLANDKKNLRELIQRYHISWITLAPAEQSASTTRARRGDRLRPTASTMPARLPSLAIRDLNITPASFSRLRWAVSGEELCGALAGTGLQMDAWHPGDLYSSMYECSAEISETSTDTNQPASLFILIRGTPAGRITSARIKVIIPENDKGKAIAEKFRSTAEVLFAQSHWPELQAALPAIFGLHNVSLSVSGARLTFAHEFTDARRFNLILDLNAETAAQRDASHYFDRSKWFPLQLEGSE